MKVLHIVTAYPRFEGDVITPWLVETVRLLKESGVDIVIFAPSYKGLKDQTIYGIPVKRFRYFFRFKEDLSHDETVPDRVGKSFWYKLIVLAYMLFGSLAVFRYCRKEKFDVIHVHWPFPHFWFGYLGKKACGARIVSSFYGAELRWLSKRLRMFESFLRWAVRASDAVTCISSHTEKEVQRLFMRDIDLIPYGASISSDSELKSSKIQGPPYILFVGRLVERKGVAYLLDAFRILSRKWSGELVIVGQGPEKENLIKAVRQMEIADRVKFPGFVSSAELKEYYRNCSVFVLPAITDSRGDTEGLGVVLIEALGYKKPVVASAVGGITDIIKDGETGLLVPEKEPERLAEVLYRILSDEPLSKSLAEKGYAYCLKLFGWDEIIGRLFKVYVRLTDSNSSQ